MTADAQNKQELKFPSELPKEKISAFCRKWKIEELSFFGSVLRSDFGPDSDIDVLVKYAADAQRSLFKHVEIQQELEGILGRPVDLVSKSAVEKSENEYRRQEILGGARVYYSDEEAA